MSSVLTKLISKITPLTPPSLTKEQLNNYPDFFQAKQEGWEKLDFYRLEYNSSGHKVIGFLIEPKSEFSDNKTDSTSTSSTAKLPCLIYNRGGSREFGKIDNKKLFYMLADYALMGYVVIASQYSGVDGGEGADECGGKEVEDLLVLKDVLQEREKADTDRIAMMGASRGGMMTYLSLKKVDWIKCAILKAAPTNEIRSLTERPELKEYLNLSYDTNNEAELKNRSAIFWADELSKNTPILLLHGNKDDKVSVVDSLEMALELQKNSHPFEMVIYEDNHQLKNNKKQVNLKIQSFLQKHL